MREVRVDEFIPSMAPICLAGAFPARNPCPEARRQDAIWRAARARLEAVPKLIATHTRPVVTSAVESNNPDRILSDTARIPAWGKPSGGRRNGKTLRNYRKDVLARIIAAAPSRERAPIDLPRRRSHAYRASVRLRARDIVRETASAFGLTIADLLSDSRAEETSTARQEAMYRIRRELLLSFVDVARVMNRTDHTTIRHGYAAHVARVERLKHETAHLPISYYPLTNS